jgi:hypothetical protein
LRSKQKNQSIVQVCASLEEIKTEKGRKMDFDTKEGTKQISSHLTNSNQWFKESVWGIRLLETNDLDPSHDEGVCFLTSPLKSMQPTTTV